MVVSVVASVLACRAEDAASVEFFEKRIRPVLVEQCYKCHSDEAKKLKGELYVDSRAGLLKGGETGPAIVPGDPAKSLLIKAISYADPDMQMPPKTRLSVQQTADLTAWVAAGAPWPAGPAASKEPGARREAFDLQKRKAEHWAWQPVASTTPPAVKDSAWATTPIDRFILARLEQQGLRPAAVADRRMLIRRVHLDLVGLPPTPAEVDSFIADTSPQALATRVDALLASPRFGERWGRHWLDLVRYADSRGHEFDYHIPNAWQYRDYVIRALNADVPYDRFVQEHLAGDLLPTPRLSATGANESVLGTGFWFLGEAVHSPVDIRLDEAERFDNMIDVTGKTFLGLTVACARCHDHKFDAISTKDYYALAGFLQSSRYGLVRFETMGQERSLAEKLWQARREQAPVIAKALAESYRPTAERLDAYLMAAREGLARVSGTAAGSSDEVFADFESGTYDGWELTGTAFGTIPQTLKTIASYQGKINAVGTWFVNSHREGEGGDAPTGTMTSRPFTITRPYLRMLVGGGNHPGRTCIDLVIDGKVALSVTGPANNQMVPVAWDLRPFARQTARLRIVDAESGGWGNIGVDQIVFSDRREAASAAAPGLDVERLSADDRKRIAALAEAGRLDATVLGKWMEHLTQAATRAGDPFHAWARATGAAELIRAAAAPVPSIGGEVVIDYARPDEPWLPDGVAFGPGPLLAGAVRLGEAITVQGVTAAAFDPFWSGLKRAANSARDPVGLDYDRTGNTLRTKTIALTTGRLFILMRGRCQLYAGVDSHTLINGPLHGQLRKKLESKDGFTWQDIDLSVYRDHRAHLEFTADSADFAIARVVQGERQPPLPAEGPRQLAQLLIGECATPEALAKGYRRVVGLAIARLGGNSIAGQEDSAAIALLADWLLQHPELLGSNAAPAIIAKPWIDQQAQLAAQIRPESQLAMAMCDGSGEDDFVMVRGSWKNRGEPAPRQLLEAIAGKQAPITQGSGRLELAQRMVATSNPFTSRVMVNRVWHHLFGRGIVASVDNFGVLGEKPSHPELLDHLASDFVRQGWSLKRLIRSVVLTSTYQMGSQADPVGDNKDPNNVLLHRMNVRRLEGEVIRDQILAISGRIDLAMGGPGVPTHLTDFMQGRGRQGGGPLDGNGRRSVYLTTWRNFLSPMMMAFDTPTPFNTIGRRAVSNVPAQALIMLNDPFVIEQARLWAKRLLAEPGLTDEQRIARMYQSAFARPPQAGETASVLDFLRQHRETLGGKRTGDDLQLWSDLAHVLMNSKEFIYIN